ncbi:MAG: cytochrome-c oxidase, cbb3-type subunit II [Alphaproteobacteria bacterium]|nr:cytochrome-c oxidase, cbb3-type subunit II [Alphaproteobacteria bacterium]MDD9920152.1 cytochrome-c oxidase, cbb3-type subunit II [Alphaproteobacteria bacterium]
MYNLHKKTEKNAIFLLLGIIIVVSIGGLVEIVPLFMIESTIEKVKGMRPYSPLELLGRNIYIREGCYTCHSQMIRPFRDEVERYGHYSLAAESMYDHPFQWGSKRTGPDLARVGGRYANEWHVDHFKDPQSVVPESVMPSYAFLAKKELHYDDITNHLKTLRIVGVPYTDEQINLAKQDVEAQVAEDGYAPDFTNRYPKAVVANFDGDKRLTEMDALIAYMQMLGTLVDFSHYVPEER